MPVRTATREQFGTRRRGQALMEYIVMAGMLLTFVVMLSLFLHAFKQSGTRTLDLVGSEYP